MRCWFASDEFSLLASGGLTLSVESSTELQIGSAPRYLSGSVPETAESFCAEGRGVVRAPLAQSGGGRRPISYLISSIHAGRVAIMKGSYDLEVIDYEQCPFCDRVFKAQKEFVFTPSKGLTLSALEVHIRSDHQKVKLRKGSNYRWVDESDLKHGRYSPTELRGLQERKGSRSRPQT